jgi:hypothetical protein
MPTALSQQVLDKARRDAAAGRTYDLTDARAPGLVLRVGKTGCTWTFRGRKYSKFVRVRLGSLDLLTLTVAREIAGAAMGQLRDTPYPPDDDWVRRWLLGKRVIHEPPKPAPSPVPEDRSLGWTYAEARTAYLAEVQRTRRDATFRDRKYMLGLPELKPIEGRPVGLIRRQELASIVASIHRSGRERHAEHLVECLRPMWSWLAGDAQQLKSGVLGRDMKELRAPERSHRDEDEDGGQGLYIPSPAELGLILAISRSGVLHPTLATAVELLLVTCQRRRTIASARRADFIEEGGLLVWKIPPRHRKTARRLGSRRSHDIPVVGRTADMVRERLGQESEWVFPATRARRTGQPVTHVASDSISHALAALPGVTATPHDIRRGLKTHGQDVLNLDEDELSVVLDHAEGQGSRDGTQGHYSGARRLRRKLAVIEPWTDLLEREAAKIVVDVGVVRAAITETRRKREADRKAA